MKASDSSIATACAAAISVLLFAVGCMSARRDGGRPVPEPIVVGQRVRVLYGGEVLEVPAPEPPARVWYLVDSVGLAHWLGLDVPYPHAITNDTQRRTLLQRLGFREREEAE